ncbi:MAG: hypothetical protein E6J87_13495 [Deltaproteobacteria bacterium]|nr:MAG: hypothetical protein E6J87_13495 [Deltaproteobacteria bacterium]
MRSLYLWPEHAAFSLLVLWVGSVVFLWAAREPMLSLLRALGEFAAESCASLARGCDSAAGELRKRARAALLAAGRLETQGRLSREINRIDKTFTERLGQYSGLSRRLDDLLVKLETDYEECAITPPQVPGWSNAVNAIARIPTPGDANVRKVLESIRESSEDAEQQALKQHRDDTSKRHKLLAHMGSCWKDVRDLMARMRDSVAAAMETTQRIHGYVEEYEKVAKEQDAAARALTFSATKLFLISALVLGVALGGALVNFQLIALPMSELVPAGARIGDLPVATISALVIVLMETALGIFAMDLLGVTDLFPKLQRIPISRRRMLLSLSLAGLFFLAGVESSLAVLRESIAEADSALKMSLSGEERVVAETASSHIPVIGQAVLGFVLPWILAMVAIPLEMLLDSGRHVVATILVLTLQGVGVLGRAGAHTATKLAAMLVAVYEIYVSIPTKIEHTVRNSGRGHDEAIPMPARETSPKAARTSWS